MLCKLSTSVVVVNKLTLEFLLLHRKVVEFIYSTYYSSYYYPIIHLLFMGDVVQELW
jgi:hypothetical protein